MAHVLEKKWRSEDVMLLEDADFSSMLISNRVLSGLTKAGFRKPSPIQMEAIPMGRFGSDLLVQAKSGTGKTLVFVVTALEVFNYKKFIPQVLILVPTREIATQICSVVKSVGCFFPRLTCESFIGGFSVAEDIKKAHRCQIVVGTLGRIKQLIELKALSTKAIRLLVFDEADEMLAVSRLDEIDYICSFLPEKKQVIATSATFPPKLKKIVFKYLTKPYLARFDVRKLALLGIIHYVRIVESSAMPLRQYNFKLAALAPILTKIKFSQCLVFCNGIHKVETLYRDIKKWGFSATYISSNKDQSERLKAIDCLKRFKCKVLVSSDVTARGIDAEYVDLVVNFDVSHNAETYLHRSGRAGRYGTIGVTISIVDDFELNIVKRIEKEACLKCYKLPDSVPVDLIKNPVLDSYAIEPSMEDFSEEAEDEKNAEPSTKKLNKSCNKGSFASEKENNKELNRTPSNSISGDADLKKQNDILQKASEKDNACITENDENNLFIETEEQSFNNDTLFKSEDIVNVNQIKLHNHNGHFLHQLVNPQPSICESLAHKNEPPEVTSENIVQNVVSGDVSVLNLNVLNGYQNTEISNNMSESKNLNLVAPNDCEISDFSFDMSNCKVQNLSVMNECKTVKLSNTITNENFYNVSVDDINIIETPLLVAEDQNVKDNFQNSDLIIHDDNIIKIDNCLNKNRMIEMVENFIQKHESMELSVSKNTDIKNLPSENSEEENLLSTHIKDLNSNRSEYYYKIFKLYQKSSAHNYIKGEIKEILNSLEAIQDEKTTHVEENISSDIKSKEDTVNSQEIFDPTLFVKASELAKKMKSDIFENSNTTETRQDEKATGVIREEKVAHVRENVSNDIENRFVLDDANIPKFHATPLHESTPHCDKSSIKITTLDDNASEQPIQNSKAFFEEISEESDSELDLDDDIEDYLASLALPSKKLESDSDSSSSVHSTLSSSSSEDEKTKNCSELSSSEVSSSSETLSSVSDSYFSSSSSCPRHNSYSGKKKLNDKKFRHPSVYSKKNTVPPYADQVKPHSFQHNYLHHGYPQFTYSNPLNFCQQPYPSWHSNAYHCTYHSVSSECRQHESRRKPRNADKNKKCHASICGQHSPACYKPSDHKCHPYSSITNCNHREMCAQWYQMFHNQWMHIQKCCHLSPYNFC